MRGGQAEFGLFVQDEQIILLWRFLPGFPWSDLPYTWHVVPAEQQVPPATLNGEERVMLNVVLVNANTGKIEALRGTSWSPEFSQRMHQAILDQAAMPWNKAAYDRKLSQIQQRATPEALLKKAVVRCTGGA